MQGSRQNKQQVSVLHMGKQLAAVSAIAEQQKKVIAGFPLREDDLLAQYTSVFQTNPVAIQLCTEAKDALNTCMHLDKTSIPTTHSIAT